MTLEHQNPQAHRDWRFLLIAVVALLVLVGVVVWALTRSNDSEGSTSDPTATATVVVSESEITIKEAYIMDPDDPDVSNQEKEVIDLSNDPASSDFRVYDPGASVLVLVLEKDGEPFDGEVSVLHPAIIGGSLTETSVTVTTNDGQAIVFVDLIDGKNLTGLSDRAKPFEIEVSAEDGVVGVLSLHVIAPLGPGSVTPDIVETKEELLSELISDPMLRAAVEKACGFTPNPEIEIEFRINTETRPQLAFVNGIAHQSRRVIPVGQPILVITPEDGGEGCILNPPCGNPSVPPGKFPETPDGFEPPEPTPIPTATPTPAVRVNPTATNTPRSTSTLPPSATNTPIVIKTNTPVSATATKTAVPPTPTRTATPRPATNTPAATFTPVGPCKTCPKVTETPFPFQTSTSVPRPTNTPFVPKVTPTQVVKEATPTPVCVWC